MPCGSQICLDQSNGRTKNQIFSLASEMLNGKRVAATLKGLILRLQGLCLRRYSLRLRQSIPDASSFAPAKNR